MAYIPHKKGMETRRCNFNLPTKLYLKVKEFADDNGYNMTTALTILINNGLNTEQTMKAISILNSTNNNKAVEYSVNN